MTLKSLKSHQERQDSTLVRLIDSLVSTLSKVVHEMTEDTHVLGDVKAGLEEQVLDEKHRHHASMRNDTGSSASNLAGKRTAGNGSLCIDLPRMLDEGGARDIEDSGKSSVRQSPQRARALMFARKNEQYREIEEIRLLGLVKHGISSSRGTCMSSSLTNGSGPMKKSKSKKERKEKKDRLPPRLDQTVTTPDDMHLVPHHRQEAASMRQRAGRARAEADQRQQPRSFHPDKSGEIEVFEQYDIEQEKKHIRDLYKAQANSNNADHRDDYAQGGQHFSGAQTLKKIKSGMVANIDSGSLVSS